MGIRSVTNVSVMDVVVEILIVALAMQNLIWKNMNLHKSSYAITYQSIIIFKVFCWSKIWIGNAMRTTWSSGRWIRRKRRGICVMSARKWSRMSCVKIVACSSANRALISYIWPPSVLPSISWLVLVSTSSRKFFGRIF